MAKNTQKSRVSFEKKLDRMVNYFGNHYEVLDNNLEIAKEVMLGTWKNGEGKGSKTFVLENQDGTYSTQVVNTYEGRLKVVCDLLGLNEKVDYQMLERLVDSNTYLTNTLSKNPANKNYKRSDIVKNYLSGLIDGAVNSEQRYTGLEETLKKTQNSLETTKRKLNVKNNKQKELTMKAEKVDTLEYRVNELEEENKDYKEQVGDFEKIIKTKNSRVAFLNSNNKDLGTHLEDANYSEVVLGDEVDFLEGSVDLLKGEVSRHKGRFRKAVFGGIIGSVLALAAGLYAQKAFPEEYNSGINKTLIQEHTNTNLESQTFNISTNDVPLVQPEISTNNVTTANISTNNVPLVQPEISTNNVTTADISTNNVTTTNVFTQKFRRSNPYSLFKESELRRSDKGLELVVLEEQTLGDKPLSSYPLVDLNSEVIPLTNINKGWTVTYNPDVIETNDGNFISNTLYQKHVGKMSSSFNVGGQGVNNYEINFDASRVGENLANAWNPLGQNLKTLLTTAPIYSWDKTKDRANVFKTIKEEVIKKPLKRRVNQDGNKENMVVQVGATPLRVVGGIFNGISKTADTLFGGKFTELKDTTFSIPKAGFGTAKEAIDLTSSTVNNVVEELIEKPFHIDSRPISSTINGGIQTITTVINNGLTGIPEVYGNFDAEGISRGAPMTVVEETMPYIFTLGLSELFKNSGNTATGNSESTGTFNPGNGGNVGGSITSSGSMGSFLPGVGN